MSANKLNVSVFQRAKKGNYYCGDSYFYKETEEEFICAIADGLGSGEFAKESSQIVINIIEKNYKAPVKDMMKECHEALVGKRGVVVGILKIDLHTNKYTFSSVGNIRMMTISSAFEKKLHIPNSGYLGSYPKPLKVSEAEMTDDMTIFMFSDGVKPSDLSSKLFTNKDVFAITETYAALQNRDVDDDITLMAIRFS